MKLAQVGSIANKANAADAKSCAADCSVGYENGRTQKMRIALISMVALLMASASYAGDEPILKFDVKRAQDIAIAAISEKYPELPADNISFKGWSADSKTNASPTVIVSYLLDKPAVRVEKDDTKTRDTESKQQTINVVLTANGEVTNVSKGQQMVFESRSKVKPRGQQPAP